MSFRRKTLRLVTALTASWALVACSQPGSSDPTAQGPNDPVSISVSLANTSFSTQGLTPQGVPYDDDGIAVDNVKVYVTNADGPVTFKIENGTYFADSLGATNYLTLSPEDPSVGVVLYDLGNPYTFEALAEDDDSNTIAWATVTQTVSTDGTVTLGLESVLGDASLSLRLPTNYVLPGQVVDLMLNVSANGAPGLKVPLADFEATYEVSPENSATVDAYSGRGVRITAEPECSAAIEVKVTVKGLVEDPSGVFNAAGEVTESYTLPCATAITGGGVVVDLENPTVEFELDGSEITGIAKDNFGIADVQVWDGPVLLAMIDPPSVGTVSQVTIDGSGNFSVDLGTNAADSVSVVAIDTSDNQTDTADTVNPNFLFVSATAAPGGDGSRSKPYDSITAAVAAVNPYGTVYMFNGTYHYDTASGEGYPRFNTGRSGITLRGESMDGTIIVPNAGTSLPGYGLLVNDADDVTFENFTVDASDLLFGTPTTGRIVAVQLAERFTMLNVKILGNSAVTGFSGVNFTSVKDATLINVTVTDIIGNALRLKATENLTLQDVSISDSSVGIYIQTAGPTDPGYYFESRNYIDQGVTSTDNDFGLVIAHEARQVADVNLVGYEYAVRRDALGDCDVSAATSGLTYYYFSDFASANSFANGTECIAPGHVFDLTTASDLAVIVGKDY